MNKNWNFHYIKKKKGRENIKNFVIEIEPENRGNYTLEVAF